MPTGPYPVGIISYHVIDTNRKELRSEDPQAKRELMIYLWYPAQPNGNEQKNSYAARPALDIMKRDFNAYVGTPLAELTFLDTLTTHAFVQAPLLENDKKYPLLIFSPGFGSPVQLYTTLLEDLASHGYIVAGINHPYVSNPTIFPDGRIILRYEQKEKPTMKEVNASRLQNTRTWIEDTRFALNELLKKQPDDTPIRAALKNQIDRNAIGIFGHSFGGSIAIDACGLDERCKAGADLDGKAPFESSFPQGFNKPFMFIIGEHSEVPEIVSLQQLSANMGEHAYFVKVKGAQHGSFGDFLLVAPSKKMAQLAPLRGIEITRKLLVNFFDRSLKGTDRLLIEPNYQELSCEKTVAARN